jgi:adenosylcobinamide kinase/adenosylcobinamide-phosphate guanylyltransferase
MRRTVLVLGGARSGKSRFAESLGEKHKGPKTYIATSEIFDEEMRLRVEQHVAQRGDGWSTLEIPLDLCGGIGKVGEDGFNLVNASRYGSIMHYDECRSRGPPSV